MSYGTSPTFTGGICSDVLTALGDFVKAGNLPQTQRTRVGFIQSLLSPLNNGSQAIPVKEDLKVKQVRIKYLQRAIESQVLTVDDGVCDGDFDDYNEVTYTTTLYRKAQWKVDKKALKTVCTDQGQFINEVLMSKFDSLARSINRSGLENQAANFGTNQRTGDALPTNINLLNSDGTPRADGLEDMVTDYNEYNEYAGIPMVIGQGMFNKYNIALKAGCCNNNGVDMLAIAQQNGYAFFLDTMANEVLGQDEFAVLAPSTVQFTPYNLHDADLIYSMGNGSANTRIVDPVTGLDYDFKVLYDDCADQIYFRLELNYDFFHIPADAYNESDPLFGSNGTLSYQAVTV